MDVRRIFAAVGIAIALTLSGTACSEPVDDTQQVEETTETESSEIEIDIDFDKPKPKKTKKPKKTRR
jgi:hypothetical protein